MTFTLTATSADVVEFRYGFIGEPYWRGPASSWLTIRRLLAEARNRLQVDAISLWGVD